MAAQNRQGGGADQPEFINNIRILPNITNEDAAAAAEFTHLKDEMLLNHEARLDMVDALEQNGQEQLNNVDARLGKLTELVEMYKQRAVRDRTLIRQLQQAI